MMRALELGTHSDASVDLAERRLLVQEVGEDSVHLVPQHHVQHLHGGRRLRHEEKMVRKVTNKWKVTCRWGPAHPSKSRSFFCGICVQASGGVVLDCSDATYPNSTSRCLNRVEQGSSDPRAD